MGNNHCLPRDPNSPRGPEARPTPGAFSAPRPSTTTSRVPRPATAPPAEPVVYFASSELERYSHWESELKLLKIGITTDVYFTRPKQLHSQRPRPDFVTELLRAHNEVTDIRHYPMRRNRADPHRPTIKTPQTWLVEDCEDVSPPKSNLCRRLKLTSPIFSTPYHGGWRKHVTATWKFLRERYTIDSPPSCGTHIRIYLARTRPMQQLRQIAQAVVHFEPAFLDLMPPYRRGNCLAKSNWLNSPGFRRGRLSRAESIDRIGKAVDANELIELMHSNPDDEHYSWSFLGLKSSRDPSVEFRQPPGSVSWEECLSWAELTAMFIGAALRGRDWALQKDGPTNVQALYRFIETSSVPGMAANDSWKRLWPLAEGRDKGSCQALRRDNVLGRMQPRRE